MPGKQTSQAVPPVQRRKYTKKNRKGSKSSIMLLIWCKGKVPMYVSLGRDVTREAASYLWEQVLLPAVFNHRLYVVNVLTGENQSVPLSGYEDTHFVSVNSCSAVCVCTQERKCSAFRVEYLTLGLTDLNLRVSLGEFGMIRGGYMSGSLCLFLQERKCYFTPITTRLLRFSFPRKQWSAPPATDIPEEIDLICPHNDLLYLLLGSGWLNIYITAYQTYNVHTDQFSDVHSIKTRVEIYNSSPWVQLDDNRLLCLGTGLNRWTWDYKTKGVYENLNPSSRYRYMTQGLTILLDKNMYWIEQENRRFNPKVTSYNVDSQARIVRILQLAS